MLRGFTLPTARHSQVSWAQTAFIAGDVEPVLTTIYRGGVKAAAFRIPVEMTAILLEDQATEDGE